MDSSLLPGRAGLKACTTEVVVRTFRSASPSTEARAPRLHADFLGFLIQAPAFSHELFKQWRGLPVVAEPGAILVHARQDRLQADGVRVEHRTSTVAWEAEAIAVDDVDVARADRVAVFQHARTFVGQRRRDSCEDFVV